MKHSAGRKELRMMQRRNRRAEGRKRAKANDLAQRHPKAVKMTDEVEE